MSRNYGFGSTCVYLNCQVHGAVPTKLSQILTFFIPAKKDWSLPPNKALPHQGPRFQGSQGDRPRVHEVKFQEERVPPLCGRPGSEVAPPGGHGGTKRGRAVLLWEARG